MPYRDDTTLGSKAKRNFNSEDTQVMSMDDEADDEDDPFVLALSQFESGSSTYEIVRVDREMLKKMPSNEVCRHEVTFSNYVYSTARPTEQIVDQLYS